MNNKIYLDSSATYGRIPRPVLASIVPYITKTQGNGSSLYSIGRESRNAIKQATVSVKKTTGADKVYWVSGSTEANNWVINNFRKGTIISSTIEHPSILNTLKYYKDEYDLNYKLVSVDNNGLIKMDELEQLLIEGADLCTIMCTNNEIGVNQNINEIYDLCHKYNCKLHTDLTQSYSHLDITKLKYDYASLSGHKFGSLIGVGTLLCNTDIKPFIVGGHQQDSMRGGTYNICGIVSMGKACEINNFNIDDDMYLYNLKSHMIDFIDNNIKDTIINSPLNKSVNNILNVSFKGIEGESLALMLDKNNICVSSGSACNSGSLEPSHVLKAMEVPDDYIYGTIRFSFSKFNTLDEIIETENVLKETVEKLRSN